MMTVLLATHNGADTLPEALVSFCRLEEPQGGWKLLIVDNGSTDNTRGVIDSFRSRLPLTYLFEPKLGKSVALNRGLNGIAGDLVLLTDDDVIPRPDWLVRAREVADLHPSFAVFGGVIVPHWEVSPPHWILPFQFPTLAITGPDWEEGPTLPGRIWGPNMLVRAQVFEAGHRFADSIGPAGSRYQMGEENDFLDRLVAAGFAVWHSKDLVVAHMIRRNQMRKEWMLRRATAFGRANYRRSFSAAPVRVALLLGFPRYLIRAIIEQALRTAWSQLFQNETKAFKDRWYLSYLIAQAAEGRAMHSSRALIGQ